MKHVCPQKDIYLNKVSTPMKMGGMLFHGLAVGNIEFFSEEEVWVMHNDEYINIVRYCPFCGALLSIEKEYEFWINKFTEILESMGYTENQIMEIKDYPGVDNRMKDGSDPIETAKEFHKYIIEHGYLP